MNKNGYIYKQVAEEELRKNVLIMGDIIEDTCMACPSRHQTILKVGFLNDLETHGHLLDSYK